MLWRRSKKSIRPSSSLRLACACLRPSSYIVLTRPSGSSAVHPNPVPSPIPALASSPLFIAAIFRAHTPQPHAHTHLRSLSHQAFDELKLEERRLEERLEENKRRLAEEGRALDEKAGQDKSRLEERIEQLQAPRE